MTLLAVCILAALGSSYGQTRYSKKTKRQKKSARTEAVHSTSKPVTSTRKPASNPAELTDQEPLPRGIEHYEQPITKEEKGRSTQIGKVDWTTQYIEATGQGVIDMERYKNPAQAKALARRAAVVVAQRNLLEIAKGVNVQGETTVEDMMTTRDFIVTRVEGIVKGATEVGAPVERDGIVEVRLRMPLYSKNGLANAVYDQVSSEQAPAEETSTMHSGNREATQDPATATESAPEKGIAFNMDGKPFDPSLFPVVVDEQGNVVFDMKGIYDPKNGKFPRIVKSTKEAMEQVGFKKGVEILNVLDAENGKIRISNADAGKFPWKKILNVAKTVGKFLLLLI